ncbi:MAG: nuclear transport factor 2 family protein [Pseudomonadota bacterium]|nr:nuclear transport factor 2 family protein [Pseudomonadota bacterium]
MKINCAARISLLALAATLAGCGNSSGDQTPATEAAVDPAAVQNYLDRQAIETTLVRYSTGLDTFDAGIYASAFTEDAEFAMEDTVYRGRAEISKVITDMVADRAKRSADKDPANDPPPSMHHVMTNAVIDITSPTTATHRSYWMTVNGGPDMYSFRIAAQGRYEDELVKRDGQWLIHRRRIMN